MNEIKAARGHQVDPNFPMICLLLSIFVTIVAWVLEQAEINKLVGSNG